MFLLKAAFWLTLVALMLPRLYGQDSGGATAHEKSGLGDIERFAVSAHLLHGVVPGNTCLADAACSTGAALIDRLQVAAREGIARAKAELKAQKALQEHTNANREDTRG